MRHGYYKEYYRSKQYPAYPTYPFSFHVKCVSVNKVTQSKQIILKKGLGNSKKDTDSSQGVEENGLLGILHYLQIMLRFTNYFTDSF